MRRIYSDSIYMMSNRQYLIVANWKMNGRRASACALITAIKQELAVADQTTVAICPPFVYLPELAEQLADSQLKLGAQNVSHIHDGAYTGEIAALMLKEFACLYVIVGHCERRMLYNESDTLVAKKFIAVQDAEMIPILCVGEQLEERATNTTEHVIARQLDEVIAMAGIKAFNNAVIAYEPVWAIGTGKTASPEQAQAVHAFIRLRLARHDCKIADTIRIIYGGSVKAANAQQLFQMADIDGGLIGGASLIATDFLAICQATR